jgi:hypothetical protein
VDGINANAFYLAGDISGERVLWEAFQTSNVAAAQLSPVLTGPFPNTGAYAWQFGVTNTFASVVQVNIVPGMSGKIRVGNALTSGLAQPDAT